MEYIYFAEKTICTLEKIFCVKIFGKKVIGKYCLFTQPRRYTYTELRLSKDSFGMSTYMQKIGEWRMRKEVRGNQGIDEGKELEKLEKLEKMLIEQNLESEKNLRELQKSLEKMFEKIVERK